MKIDEYYVVMDGRNKYLAKGLLSFTEDYSLAHKFVSYDVADRYVYKTNNGEIKRIVIKLKSL